MKQTKLKPNACPRCQHVFDRASSVFESRRPSPGDLSICIECEAFLRFGEALELIALTDADVAALPADVLNQLAHAAYALHLVKRGRAR